ncbi:hypothetical protein [Laspinema palackyanum]|uniref:hypothetical protein n=1 Tax=Laspinema palackyanum TaxID=3231601 RepID=UPI00345C8411|nr:hypothetical protein [Laspinema sp. D2c]
MTYSDSGGGGDDGNTGWVPSCDVCYLLNSIKSTVESNQARLSTMQTTLDNMITVFNANFNTDFPWLYEIKEKCDSKSNKQYIGTAKGIPALVLQNRDIVKLLKDIQHSTCTNDNGPVVPEWWQLRAGADRPQLVVLCAEKNPDDTLKSAKYVVTIPHYQHSDPHNFPPFTRLEKGSYQGVLTLKDNSKVIIYGKTIQETRNVLYNIYQEIDTAYRDGFYPKVGPIGNPDFLEITVYPKYGKYFPSGVTKTVPLWTVAYG